MEDFYTPPSLFFVEKLQLQIQRNLEDIAMGRTTLIITHRLSTIKNVDKILVIKAGRIVESGRYQDLMESNGVFRALWDSQHYLTEHDKKE